MLCRNLRITIRALLALLITPEALASTPLISNSQTSLLRLSFPLPQQQRQLNPSAQLRTQSISDPEHFPVNSPESVLPIGDSIARHSERLNNTAGMCACGVEPFSRQANFGPIGQTSFKDVNEKRFSVSVVNFEYALKVFKTLARAFVRNESLDGCYARAHRISYFLEKHGLQTGKVMAIGDFRLRDRRTASKVASWRYHMAPLIAINDGANVSAWVLDPTLFNEPVPLTAWLGLLVHQKGSSLKEAYLTSRFVYHPNQKKRNIERWDEKDLADANRTLKSLAYVNRIKKSPGLVRMELTGLKASLEPLKAMLIKTVKTSDTSTIDTLLGHSSPETSVLP
jgi:hypothetical protein